MITILKLLVNNNPGVLDRIAGLFRHNGWNIDSISAAGIKENLSQINIVYKSRFVDEQMLHNKLSRVDYVKSWEECTQQTHIISELVILKIREKDIPTLLIEDKKILYRDGDILFVEYAAEPWKIDELLENEAILSFVRSGGLGIAKKEEQI